MIEYICGVDYSITSPGLCIHPKRGEWNPKYCKYLFFSDLKKHTQHQIFENVFMITKKVKSDERMRRYFNNADNSVEFMLQNNVTNVNIEGYSFASTSNMAIQIGENGGILRSMIVNSGMKYIETPPSRIKKFATQSGRSDKFAMLDQFKVETGLDLFKLFNRKAASSPIDDIADSYFICKYLFEELNKQHT